MKRLLTAAFAAMLAATLCIPVGALADEVTSEPVTTEAPAPELADAEHPLTGMSAPAENEPATLPDDTPVTTATECSLTFNYYEVTWYDDDVDMILLGQYVVNGVRPGQVVNVWDYVFDIPGHYFFDGTAPSITISFDNEKNVIDLMYGKLYNSEFTVNYYLMNGANLAADNWADALLPTTTFRKMGEQTFVDQRFDMEVKGDDFEYPVNGLYVVDTFPASIRLTEDPADNMLNVLYVPSTTHLPDDAEVFEVPERPEESEAPNAPEGASPEGTAPEVTPARPGDILMPTPITPTEATLPSFGAPYEPAQMEGIAFIDGNLETGDFEGPLEFTEEMIANPVLPETAQRYADAFEAGTPITVGLPVITQVQGIQVGAALFLFLIAFLAVCIYAFERGKQGK